MLLYIAAAAGLAGLALAGKKPPTPTPVVEAAPQEPAPRGPVADAIAQANDYAEQGKKAVGEAKKAKDTIEDLLKKGASLFGGKPTATAPTPPANIVDLTRKQVALFGRAAETIKTAGTEGVEVWGQAEGRLRLNNNAAPQNDFRLERARVVQGGAVRSRIVGFTVKGSRFVFPRDGLDLEAFGPRGNPLPLRLFQVYATRPDGTKARFIAYRIEAANGGM